MVALKTVPLLRLFPNLRLHRLLRPGPNRPLQQTPIRNRVQQTLLLMSDGMKTWAANCVRAKSHLPTLKQPSHLSMLKTSLIRQTLVLKRLMLKSRSKPKFPHLSLQKLLILLTVLNLNCALMARAPVRPSASTSMCSST